MKAELLHGEYKTSYVLVGCYVLVALLFVVCWLVLSVLFADC